MSLGCRIEGLEPRTLLAIPKIMPLGDSITEGWSGHGSYRPWLWNSLANAGYVVDLVGGQTGIASGIAPPNPNYDQNHEGHSGFLADQVKSNIVAWANANKPDIVLLHIGTNDLNSGQTNASTDTDIRGIIDNLRTVVPNVKILLAQIIPLASNISGTVDLNGRIATIASQKTTAQSPITLVDQYSGFNTSNLWDGIHPNDTGDQQMAAKWYSALAGILGTPTPPPAGTYVDALPFAQSPSNGWGPVEVNRSNGEQAGNDGRVLTLNGVSSMRGLGVHAGSDVRYNISGKSFTEFDANIGVDDEIPDNGVSSLVFQVYVDNVLKYDSGVMGATTASKSVQVALPNGASVVRLVVNDGGNGNGQDHGDWANARFVAGVAVSPPAAPSGLGASVVNQQIKLNWTDASNNESGFRVERKAGANGTYAQIADLPAGTTSYTDSAAAAGTTYFYHVYAYNSGGPSGFSNEANATIPLPSGTVYVSDLNYTVNANGWGPAEKDRSNGEQAGGDGKTITLNGVTYAKGLGVHAYSEIIVPLSGQYTQFSSFVGVDDEMTSFSTIRFQVYVDNVLKFDSGVMNPNSPTQQAVVSVAGATTLKLVVNDGGDGNGADHGDWADAKLITGIPPSAPSAPSGLLATLGANNVVSLSWVDGSTDETGFRIQRKLGANGTWGDVKTVGANVTSTTDTGPFGGSSTYFYRVIAFNAGGDSTPSNEQSITTPIAPPALAWVSDLTWSSMQNGWGPVEKDRSNGEQGATDGKTISLRGQTYTKGLGTHGFSKIVYNLGGAYTTFTSDLGVDDETGGNGTVIFE
ncbi:MAG TPA: NPCBM/NEW2 domain-containing protein, partial [Tepidisphaeraceae bacterium]